MKMITVFLPETYIKALDQLVYEHVYPNRAEAIRFAIHDLISAKVWRRKLPVQSCMPPPILVREHQYPCNRKSRVEAKTK